MNISEQEFKYLVEGITSDSIQLLIDRKNYTFGQWLELNHFTELNNPGLPSLYEDEMHLLENAAALSLETIAMQRINAINTILQQYE